MILAIHTLSDAWSYAFDGPTMDFFTFWSVPQALATGSIENIYAPSGQTRIAELIREESSQPWVSQNQRQTAALTTQFYGSRVDVTASPFLYAMVGMLSTGDYSRDQRHYFFVSLASLVVATVLLCRLLSYSAVETALILSVVSAAFAPLASDLRVGNVNQVQFLVISLMAFAIARFHRLTAGVLLGLSIMFKPNILIIGLLAVTVDLVDRDYRRLTRMLGGVAFGVGLAFVISRLYFGRPGMWMQFIASLRRTLGVSYPLADGNFSLSTLLFGATDARLGLVVSGLLVLSFLLVVLRTRLAIAGELDGEGLSRWALDHALATTGIGCGIMLLGSSLVWLHYYVLLIPLILYLARPPLECANEHGSVIIIRRVAACGALILLSIPAERLMSAVLYESIAFNVATGVSLGACLVALATSRQRLLDASVSRVAASGLDQGGEGPLPARSMRRELASGKSRARGR